MRWRAGWGWMWTRRRERQCGRDLRDRGGELCSPGARGVPAPADTRVCTTLGFVPQISVLVARVSGALGFVSQISVLVSRVSGALGFVPQISFFARRRWRGLIVEDLCFPAPVTAPREPTPLRGEASRCFSVRMRKGSFSLFLRSELRLHYA